MVCTNETSKELAMNVEFYGGVWHGQRRDVTHMIHKWTVRDEFDGGLCSYTLRRFGPRWYYVLESISDDEFLAGKVSEAVV